MNKLKLVKRLLVGLCCLALLLISWIIAANSKSAIERQKELLEQAAALMNDGIYVRAVPLLEEAASYNTKNTWTAEEDLKKAYLALVDTTGYKRKYLNLLDAQMSRAETIPDVFLEAAEYYLAMSKTGEALAILKSGIAATGDERLVGLYENSRYAYGTNRTSYDYAAAISGSMVQVQVDGLWGLASSDGVLLIPCEYEKISTFSVDRALVKKDGEIYAVNIDNNKLAIPGEEIYDFGNLGNERVALLTDEGWRRATGEFVIGAASFEQLGMISGGYYAAKTDGRWGVIDTGSNWLVPPEYDEIIMDELGRCYGRGAVFARNNGIVFLLLEGQLTGDAFEDARPFSNEGYAAVMNNGKWGFIDTDGTVIIDCIYDDALSFGQHLAAVRTGEFWGYISLDGRMVIDAEYLEAKSFCNGSAPVLTERGWQFITLVEYKKAVGLY